MTLQNPTGRKPSLDWVLLLLLIFISSTIDLLQNFRFFGVSGLGIFEFGAAAAVWILWSVRPTLPRSLWVTLVPLVLFQIDAIGTLTWYAPNQGGIQLLVVSVTFLGLILLTARTVADNPAVALTLVRVLSLSSIITILLFLLRLYLSGSSPYGIIGVRSFGLGALPLIAVLLARWRGYPTPQAPAGSRRAPLEFSQRPIFLIGAIVILALVFLSMSRTALVIGMLLFPLALALRGDTKGLLSSALLLCIGAALFVTILYFYRPYYNRFFGEDAHLMIGGVAINGTGRTKIWQFLINGVGDDWLFGKGLSSSEAMVDSKFSNVGQPHNDYLRFYFDQGIFGLLLWLMFMVALVRHLAGNLRNSIIRRTKDYPLHLSALLCLTAVSLSMLTDNPICYSFVMVPLAILIGCSLGTGALRPKSSSFNNQMS